MANLGSENDHNYLGNPAELDEVEASSDNSDGIIHRTRNRTRWLRTILSDSENTDHDYLASNSRSVNLIEDEDDVSRFIQNIIQQQEEVSQGNNEENIIQEQNNVERDRDHASPEHVQEPEVLEGDAPVEVNDGADGNNANEFQQQQLVPEAPTLDPVPAVANVIDLRTPTPAKKRKRTSKTNTPVVKATASNSNADEDDDEGFVCPICLDNWEMSGEHRMVSLRCGHIFGESCIRRWLNESARQTGIKTCPQCKTKATYKDIRCLYAKRLRALDRTEEHRLREQLEEERTHSQALQMELATMKMSVTLITTRMQTLEADNERMRSLLRNGGGVVGGASSSIGYAADAGLNTRLQSYKLFMERNIDISRDPGCRVLVYADQNATMLVSQKSSQSLFPGYGLRFIDVPTFRPKNFLYASARLVRDVSLSANQQQVAVTSMETRAKLFDLRAAQVSAVVFAPGDKAIWSCGLDRAEREHFLYLGSQHGSTYLYDVRQPNNFIDEFKMPGDFTPVINVVAVPSNKHFPSGGFIVCKLQSLWFYEYSLDTAAAIPTKLNVEGPFIAINFDVAHESLLVSVRSNARIPQSRYLLGEMCKVDNVPVFAVKVTFLGSKTTPVMTRCTQIAVEANTLVAGYIQDVKLLTLFDAVRAARVQSLPVQEVIYDTCPVYTSTATFLAALTETKCRIYKVSPTS